MIQFSRAVLVEHEFPSITAHFLLLAETALILGTGILVFRRFGPGVAEHV